MRRIPGLALFGLLSVASLRAVAAQDAASDAAALDRLVTLALARPTDGPFVLRLVREARASERGIERVRARLDELASDPTSAFAARCVAGHVARALRDVPRAREAYAAAIELRPRDPIPHLGLGRIARDGGDRATAAAEFTAAYEGLPEGDERRAAALEIGRVALASRDFDAVERWFGIATRGRPRFERAELARAYAEAGEHERAVAVLTRLESESRGDPREHAPALRDLGLELVEAGRFDEAVATLTRARVVARGDIGLELEIDDALVEAHRRAGRLDRLVDELVARRPRDAASLARIASLAEELGRDEVALATWARVVAASRTDVDARARRIRLLLRLGRVEEAVTEERSLVELAPRAARFFVPAIERLQGFGRQDEAFRLFDLVASRAGDDAAAHAALADLAERLGDAERLVRELEVLVRIEPGEPSHRIALATERLSRGERDSALAMLDTALREAANDPDDLATVALALADRGFDRAALDALRAALATHPSSLSLLRAYAGVLDPTGDRTSRRATRERERDAVGIYERVVAHPDADPGERREARRRIVALERDLGRLEDRLRTWDAALDRRDDSAAEAAHFLLEARQSERPFDAAAVERVAARVIAVFPRDLEAHLALERARTVRSDHAGAIEVLERLVDLDPTRTDAYVERLVAHAEALYRDDDAVRYARLGIERLPNDPRAETRLGDLLRRRNDAAGAMAAYRRALALDDRRADVWLALASLAVAEGDVETSVRAYDKVLRLGTDDDSVARAAEQAASSLSALGRDDAVVELLLPQIAQRPRLAALHRALFAAFERRVRALERRGDVEGRADLGRRGLAILLESLADPDGDRAARAARLLGRLGVDAAFDALLATASRHPSETARRAALVAAASIATPERAASFRPLLEASERRTRMSAALILASFGTSAEERATFRASTDSFVRGAFLLASELEGEKVPAEVVESLLAHERDPSTRAVAILASARHGDTFLAAIRAGARGRDLVGAASRTALARAGTRDADAALAELVAGDDDVVANDALAAHLGRERGAIARARLAAAGDLGGAVAAVLDDARVGLGLVSERLVTALRDAVAARPTSEVLRMLRRVARVVDGSVLPRDGDLVRRVVEATHDPDPAIRTEAFALLARPLGALDPETFAHALEDADARVVRAAIAWATPELAGASGERLVRLLEGHDDFSVRCAVAEHAQVAPSETMIAALERALRVDRNPFVREAAAASLASLAPASEARRRAATSDPEPRVRAAAGAGVAETESRR